MNSFETRLLEDCRRELFNISLKTLQVNVGFRCNLSCSHCHLGCGPDRSEMMNWEVMQAVIDTADRIKPEKVDVTGGAPELNPNFRIFLDRLAGRGHSLQTRTNLAALLMPGMEDLPDFFRARQIRLVASLPCWLEDRVCAQRGKGTYQQSIEALKRLNEQGYGQDPDLGLDLVYNPDGPFLPPSQSELEPTYRRELSSRFGIRFSNLLTITNMPIGRFWDGLKKHDLDREYMRTLFNGFNCHTVDGLMCRHQICVAWDGKLFDCDFNLALNLGLEAGLPGNIRDFDPGKILKRKIRTGEHCFGCTAGFGSSCGGALIADRGQGD